MLWCQNSVYRCLDYLVAWNFHSNTESAAQRRLSVPGCLRVIVQRMYLQHVFVVAYAHWDWEKHKADERGTAYSYSVLSPLLKQETVVSIKECVTWWYTPYPYIFKLYCPSIHLFSFVYPMQGRDEDGAIQSMAVATHTHIHYLQPTTPIYKRL